MKKKITMIILTLLIVAFSWGCSQQDSKAETNNQEALLEEKNELLNEKEQVLKEKEESLKEREAELNELEAELEEKENEQESEKVSKSDQNDSSNDEDGSQTKTENTESSSFEFDNLSSDLKAYLAATIVDERAMSPDLLGYSIMYGAEGENLLVQVHSGVGVGHPQFLLQISSDTITPISGAVNVDFSTIKDTPINPTPVSKESLYDKYIENKDSFDKGLSHVGEDSNFTMAQYEEYRSYIQ